MRTCLVALLLILALPCAAAQTKPMPKTVKVKIEATELDKTLLLDKLNQHGADHGLKFELADQGYDNRIVFATGQAPFYTIYGQVNSSGAHATVFDAQGHELFDFQRSGRGTDKGATNAVAKEIIKRLLQLKHAQAPEPGSKR